MCLLSTVCIDCHVEQALPRLVAVGAGQDEGYDGLVGHVIADGEREGIIKVDSGMGVYSSNRSRALCDGDIRSVTTQCGRDVVRYKVTHVAEANTDGLALAEVDLPVGVVEGEIVEEHMSAVGIIETKLKVLWQAVHASDVEVEDVGIVDSSKTKRCGRRCSCDPRRSRH